MPNKIILSGGQFGGREVLEADLVDGNKIVVTEDGLSGIYRIDPQQAIYTGNDPEGGEIATNLLPEVL